MHHIMIVALFMYFMHELYVVDAYLNILAFKQNCIRTSYIWCCWKWFFK